MVPADGVNAEEMDECESESASEVTGFTEHDLMI